MDFTGLDFQKKILGPPGLQVFIFGRQDKYSSCQKLSSRKNRIKYTKGLNNDTRRKAARTMLSYIKLFKGPQFTALDYFNFTQWNSGMATESLISIIQACLC